MAIAAACDLTPFEACHLDRRFTQIVIYRHLCFANISAIDLQNEILTGDYIGQQNISGHFHFFARIRICQRLSEE